MKNRLLTSVLCSLVGISTVIQADPTRPRLVVGIVVDQLRTDYIEYLQSLFGEGGFRRLMHEGAYLRNVDFPTASPDAVSATAMLYTGAMPSQTGISQSGVYDRSRSRMQPVLAHGNSYTPQPLLLSTVTDELVIDGIGLGSVYSLSADPQQAVVMAGHAGKGAYWISDHDARWTGAPYYNDTYSPLGRAGYRMPSQKLDTMQWKPVLNLDRYPGIPAQKRHYPFRYTFPHSDREAITRFLASPMANREITRAAIDCLQQMHMGSNPQTIDMLNIGYSAAPYKYVKDGDYRLELQDTYLRLDADLAQLFEAIDRTVGLDKTLVFLSSTGYYDDATVDAEKYRIPTGRFSVKRAVSLLNSYLSATYGNDTYISGYAASQFYLNDKAITTRGLDSDRIAADARDFLARMAGVSRAFTMDDIVSGGADTQRLRNSLDPKHCGDLYVNYTPGWTVVDDTAYPVVEHQVRTAVATAPFFLMGADVPPQVIGTPVDATVIAPTVTQTLRIRAPNGASARPLLLNSGL